MSRPTLAEVQPEIDALPDTPESEYDPRWVYELSKEQTYRAWGCGICGTRRDEHADQIEGRFPALDIDDHKFMEVS